MPSSGTPVAMIGTATWADCIAHALSPDLHGVMNGAESHIILLVCDYDFIELPVEPNLSVQKELIDFLVE